MPEKKKQDRLAWWREARFGMFIHWGVYAVPAGIWKRRNVKGIGEWIMFREKIPVRVYEKLAKRFNPVKFNAREWVRLAKDAGQKYLVITAKHHDGFAMYDSACSDYDIVDATPWGKDPMKDLARECAKAGIRLCFYYSQAQDWHDPDGANNAWDYPNEAEKDFERYLRRKCIPQVKELLTQYGPIGLIWFDTPAKITRPQSMRLKQLVHRLQPGCLVSGRVGHGVGDYGSLGDNEHPVGPLAGHWETPCTINDTWGYKSGDKNWKSTDTLVRLLVNCASKGVNYLLNVGPTAEGVIPAPSVARLRGVGRWLKVNGEAVYGTQASPFANEFDWGRVTCRPGKLYLHVMTWPRGALFLPGLRNRVKEARILGDARARVRIAQRHDRKRDDHRVEVALPRKRSGKHVTVVALDIAGAPDVNPTPVQGPDGTVILPAHQARLRGPKSVRMSRNGSVEGWLGTRPSLTWSFRLDEPGRYRVFVQSVLHRNRAQQYGTHAVKVTLGRESARGRAGAKDMIMDPSVNFLHVAESDIGILRAPNAGVLELTLRAETIAEGAIAGFTARGVRLAKIQA